MSEDSSDANTKFDLPRAVTTVAETLYLCVDAVVGLIPRGFDALDDFFRREIGGDLTLEETIVEKIGGGPHGYGDPADTKLREEEHYLFPKMVWKKIRYEKCFDVSKEYYNCLSKCDEGKVINCHQEETALLKCKQQYYAPEKIDEIEQECISEYLKLRSKFRESADEEDLWKIKMLMLEPVYDKIRQYEKEGKMTKGELEELKPKTVISSVFS